MAVAFRDWLPQVIQAAEPWLSESMDRGAQWFATIGAQLKTAAYGILCVTPENAGEPWVLFEAGALAIHTSERLACLYLLDMTPAGLPQPLGQLQAATADREGTWQVIETINSLLDDSVRLPDGRLRRAFDKWWQDLEVWWQDLEVRIKAAREIAHELPAAPARSTDEKLDEVLEIVRALQRSGARVLDTTIPATSAGLLGDAVNRPGWGKDLGLAALRGPGVPGPFDSLSTGGLQLPTPQPRLSSPLPGQRVTRSEGRSAEHSLLHYEFEATPQHLSMLPCPILHHRRPMPHRPQVPVHALDHVRAAGVDSVPVPSVFS